MRPLSKLCCGLGVKGTLLLAREGINGTIAGTPEAIDQVLDHIRALPGCETLELKFADAETMPFHRMKVRIKREIVTLGAGDLDPVNNAGTYVEPADWNALIAQDDVVVIDTRNAYEAAIGTFEGAIDPEDRQLQRLPRLVPRLPRDLGPGRPAAQGGDVLHRRHPLREVDGLPQERGRGRGLPPQGRHPELSGDHARPSRACGMASASCSTSGWRSATAWRREPTPCAGAAACRSARRIARRRTMSRASPAPPATTATARRCSPPGAAAAISARRPHGRERPADPLFVPPLPLCDPRAARAAGE
jgi:hypothetical protein